MKAITNVTIVLRESMVFDGVILIKDGKIVDAGEAGAVRIPEHCEIIDGGGSYAGPGLIDIHTHAAGGKWFYEAPQEACRTLLAHGVTKVLPALYFNLSQQEYIDAIRLLKKESTRGAGRIIAGINMEGPYLNPKFGADQSGNKWAAGVFRQQYLPLVQEARNFAKIWCIAPELEGIESFVEDVTALSPGAVLSVAHSEAAPAQILRFVPQGLRLATHHTNATGDLPKYPECRGVCVDETVNYCDDLYAELICDSRGIHVDPFMLRLVRKIKGSRRLILISDCCVFNGPVPPGYDGVTDINFDFEGQIAGSRLTLDVACRNFMKHTGAGLCEVFCLASYNPAKLLGLASCGEIKPGNDADIVLCDDKMNVRAVILQGEPV